MARALSVARAGVIVAGPLPARDSSLAQQLGDLANALQFPIMAEATSQVRFELADHPLACGEFAWLFCDAAWRRRIAADVVLALGAPPACRELEIWTSEPGVARYVLCEHEGADPEGNGRLIVCGELSHALTRLREELKQLAHRPNGAQRAFAAALQGRGRRCRELCREDLARKSSSRCLRGRRSAARLAMDARQ
jgi:2-succinyl-5-enolpyruvyl-6-hydroxy-3-cyclohexene-1-carboxylate synthase